MTGHRSRLLILFVILAVSLGFALAAPASADHKNDGDFQSWCVTAESGDTVTDCSESTIQQHKQITFNEYKFYDASDKDLILLPEVENNAGEDAEIEIIALHRGQEFDSVRIPVDEGDTESFQFELDVSSLNNGDTVEELGYKVNVYDSQGEHKGEYREGPESYRISDELVSSNTIFTEQETFQVVPNKDETIIAIENRVLDISRYNAGGETTKTLEEDRLPPLQYNEKGEQTNSPAGEILFPERLKQDKDRPAVIENTEDEIHFGTAYYGVRDAERQRLNVYYGLQAEEDTDYIQVKIVDRNGNPISPDMVDAEERRLNQTVDSGANFNTNEQYKQAVDDGTIEENSKTINLTDGEKKYINENYEAYVVYDATDGDNTFFLYRATISSSDVGKQADEEGVYINGPDSVQRTQQNTWYANNTSGVDEEDVTRRNWFIDGEQVHTGKKLQTSFSESGNYTLKVTSKSKSGEIYSDTKTVIVQNFSEKPGTFNTTYTPIKSEDEYDQISLQPDEEFTVKVTVRNNGDSTVEREVSMWEFYNENFNSRNTSVDSATVRVAPQSTKTVQLSTSWPPEEYGNRTIRVYEQTGTSTPGDPIPRQSKSGNTTSVYVLQPATVDIQLVKAPQSHLVYDNFNVEAVVQNEGDLDVGEADSPYGEPSVTIKFDEWIGNKPVQLEGGDVRAGQPGEETTVRFTRNGTNYTPSLPGLDPADRPNSPYSRTEGTYEMVTTPENPFAQPNNDLYTELTENSTDNSTKVRIYYAEIITMKVNDSGDYVRETDNEWQASVYPYIANESEFRQENSADGDTGVRTRKFATDKELVSKFGAGSMPATGKYQLFHPVSEGYDDNDNPINPLYANITVYNNGTADTGRARVYITTNRTGFNLSEQSQYDPYNKPDISGEIVGIAGLEMEPYEKHNVRVPVVIPNVEENNGTHNLQAHVRESPDYIRQYPDGFEAQYETNITIGTFGDIILEDFENETEEINELCSGRGENGNCNGNPSNTTANFTYKNRGGSEGDFTISAWFEWMNDPTNKNHSEATQVECIANDSSTCSYMYNTNNFWNQSREQTIPPEDNETWMFEHQFEEPGIYELRANILRKTTNEDSSQFEEKNIEGGYPDRDNTTKTIRVLDITDPISRFTWDDKNSCCNQNMPNENTIWEGGTMGYDGTEYNGKPEDHSPPSSQGSGSPTDNVGIEEWEWEEDGSSVSSSSTWEKRYDDPGTYTIELTTYDYEAITDGQNSDEKTHDINVREDNTEPNLEFTITDYGTNSIDKANPADDISSLSNPSVWSEYGFIDTKAEAQDNGIGIEYAQIITTSPQNSCIGGCKYNKGQFQNEHTYSSGSSETCDDYSNSEVPSRDPPACFSFPTPTNDTTETGTWGGLQRAGGGSGPDDGGGNECSGPNQIGASGYQAGFGIAAQDFAQNNNSNGGSVTVATDSYEPCVDKKGTTPSPYDNANCTQGNVNEDEDSRCYNEETGGDSSTATACVKVDEEGPDGTPIGFDYGDSDASWSGSPSTAEACVTASAYTPEPEEPDCDETTAEEGETVTETKTLRIEDYHNNYNTTTITAKASSDDRSKSRGECNVNVKLTSAEGDVQSEIRAEGKIETLDGRQTANWELQYKKTDGSDNWKTFGSGQASEGDSFDAETQTNCAGDTCEYDIRAYATIDGDEDYSDTKTVTTGNPPS